MKRGEIGAKRGRKASGCVSKQGASWRGHYQSLRDGKQVRIRTRLGSVSEMTEEQARARLDAIMQADAGTREHASAITEADVVIPLPWDDRASFVNEQHSRAAMSVARITFDLMSRGFQVFHPVSDAAPCDLIVLVHGWKLVRLEVKTARFETSGEIFCDVTRNVGKFDVLGAVTPDGKVHYIAAGQITNLLYPFRKLSRYVPAQSPTGAKY